MPICYCNSFPICSERLNLDPLKCWGGYRARLVFPAGFRAKEEQQAVCQPWPKGSTGWRASEGISNQRAAGTSSEVSWARRDLVISVETSEASWKFHQVCLSRWFGHQNVISGRPEDLLIYVKSYSEWPVKHHLHTDSSKLNKGWRVQEGSKTVMFFFQEIFYLTGRKMSSAKIKGSLQDSSFQLLLKCVFESWETLWPTGSWNELKRGGWMCSAKNNVRSTLRAQKKRRLAGGHREALKEQGWGARSKAR